MDFLSVVLAGTLVGVATGLLPGLHVNTIAAVSFALVPTAGADGAWFLLAVGTVHTIVNILPATYLGAPDEDDVLAVLPAHRLLLAGRGAEAVAVSVAASLTSLVAAGFLGWVIHMMFAHRPIVDLIDQLTPFVLVATMVLLWTQELRRGVQSVLAAALVSALAASLGWLATTIPLSPLVQVPPTTLLPLLGGLFGAAGLTVSLQKPPVVPWQPDLRRSTRRLLPASLGSLVAGVTALMPGLTASVATAMVPGIRSRPLHAVAAMSAINTAHGSLAMLVWATSGRVRSGLAQAFQSWHPIEWVSRGFDVDIQTMLIVMAIAGVLGSACTITLDFALRRQIGKLPSRGLSMGGLAFLTLLVVILSGWAGAVIFALAIAIGRLPVKWGIRRVHLVAALIVPALIWTWM